MNSTIIHTALYFAGSPPPSETPDSILVYIPSLNKCSYQEDEEWETDPATCLLTSDVLVIYSLQEIAPHSDHWIEEHMSATDYEDLRRAAPAICKIVEQSRARASSSGSQYRCEFIGIWSEEGSTEWQTGHWEIDAINFEGEGMVVPIPPMPPASPKISDLLKSCLTTPTLP